MCTHLHTRVCTHAHTSTLAYMHSYVHTRMHMCTHRALQSATHTHVKTPPGAPSPHRCSSASSPGILDTSSSITPEIEVYVLFYTFRRKIPFPLESCLFHGLVFLLVPEFPEQVIVPLWVHTGWLTDRRTRSQGGL